MAALLFYNIHALLFVQETKWGTMKCPDGLPSRHWPDPSMICHKNPAAPQVFSPYPDPLTPPTSSHSHRTQHFPKYSGRGFPSCLPYIWLMPPNGMNSRVQTPDTRAAVGKLNLSKAYLTCSVYLFLKQLVTSSPLDSWYNQVNFLPLWRLA